MKETHNPFDAQHQRIAGKTHSSLRYFAKKYMHLSAVEIIEKMNEHYPLFIKFFKPEVRKI